MLTLNNNGELAAITHVEKKIHAKYDKELREGYAYFFRTDGSIWRYCFERKEFEEVMSAEQQEVVPADGDVNGDGEFGVTDVVTFQKWLLAEPDAALKD